MNLFQLIYFSISTVKFTEKELQELLKKARSKNELASVTGLLLYLDFCFLQILEGKKETVLATYERIKKDGRHEDVVIVYENESRERSFDNWSMGFETVSFEQCKKIAGFTDISDSKFITDVVKGDSSRIMQILESFYKFG